jgi:hypothetical protein
MPAKLTIFIHLGFYLGALTTCAPIIPYPHFWSIIGAMSQWAPLFFTSCSWTSFTWLKEPTHIFQAYFDRHNLTTHVLRNFRGTPRLRRIRNECHAKVWGASSDYHPHNLQFKSREPPYGHSVVGRKASPFFVLSWLNKLKLSKARHRIDSLMTNFFRVIFKNTFLRRILGEF